MYKFYHVQFQLYRYVIVYVYIVTVKVMGLL